MMDHNDWELRCHDLAIFQVDSNDNCSRDFNPWKGHIKVMALLDQLS